MSDQQHINYARIAHAIAYIEENFKAQPSLEAIAAEVNLSTSHFQRLFVDWAGVSPKKFMQYLSLEYAKSLLQEQQASVLDTAYQTGLSGSSRLHDLFISIESMTPGEFKNNGENLRINYSFAKSLFGKLILASTTRGICHIAFEDNETSALATLKQRFAKAEFYEVSDVFHQQALSVFEPDYNHIDTIKLHLKGTPFQLKIWESLLKIPSGNLTTYGKIAQAIGKPKASRAVGTAIGQNPVAFLIPCHRVIRGDGHCGGYMWGTTRKSAILGWEAAQLS